MSDIITPDGVTPEGKKFLSEKLAGKYTPEQIKDIIHSVDLQSLQKLIDRSPGVKVADAFKRAIPLVDSTSEKMSNEIALLFKKEIPGDIDDMKAKLGQIIQKKY